MNYFGALQGPFRGHVAVSTCDTQIYIHIHKMLN